MTPEHLRILKTLPKVIEAVKAFQAEADELLGLLGPGHRPKPAGLENAQHERDFDEATKMNSGAPPVLVTLRAVPDPRAEETRRAAEEELARRQAARSPEQVEADNYLAAHAAERKSILGAILPGGAP